MVETQGKAQESQAQAVSQAFSSEMSEKMAHVPDAPKTAGSRIEGDSAGAGESCSGQEREKERKKQTEDAGPGAGHPFKGRVLDIRGS